MAGYGDHGEEDREQPSRNQEAAEDFPVAGTERVRQQERSSDPEQRPKDTGQASCEEHRRTDDRRTGQEQLPTQREAEEEWDDEPLGQQAGLAERAKRAIEGVRIDGRLLPPSRPQPVSHRLGEAVRLREIDVERSEGNERPHDDRSPNERIPAALREEPVDDVGRRGEREERDEPEGDERQVRGRRERGHRTGVVVQQGVDRGHPKGPDAEREQRPRAGHTLQTTGGADHDGGRHEEPGPRDPLDRHPAEIIPVQGVGGQEHAVRPQHERRERRPGDDEPATAPARGSRGRHIHPTREQPETRGHLLPSAAGGLPAQGLPRRSR